MHRRAVGTGGAIVPLPQTGQLLQLNHTQFICLIGCDLAAVIDLSGAGGQWPPGSDGPAMHYLCKSNLICKMLTKYLLYSISLAAQKTLEQDLNFNLDIHKLPILKLKYVTKIIK